MILKTDKEIRKWLTDYSTELYAIGSAFVDPHCASLVARAPMKYFRSKLGHECHQFIRSEVARGVLPSSVSAISYGVIDEEMAPQLDGYGLQFADQIEHVLLILRDKAMFRIMQGFPAQLKKFETIDDAATALVDEIQSFNLEVGSGSIEATEIVDEVESLFLPADAFTGIRALDEMLSIRRGNLVVLAGRPAVGKSWLGLQMCGRTLKLGGTALYVSLEMSPLEVGKRLSMWGGAPQTVEGVKEYLSQARGFFIDSRSQTPESVRREVGRLGGVDIVVVDYLQLMSPDAKKAQFSRNDEMAVVSRGLKRMAVDLGIPVIAICQLNRQGAVKPSLHHIRDSGAIEADADAVVMLYELDGSLVVDVKKNRHGRTGATPVNFDPTRCSLY